MCPCERALFSSSETAHRARSNESPTPKSTSLAGNQSLGGTVYHLINLLSVTSGFGCRSLANYVCPLMQKACVCARACVRHRGVGGSGGGRRSSSSEAPCLPFHLPPLSFLPFFPDLAVCGSTDLPARQYQVTACQLLSGCPTGLLASSTTKRAHAGWPGKDGAPIRTCVLQRR